MSPTQTAAAAAAKKMETAITAMYLAAEAAEAAGLLEHAAALDDLLASASLQFSVFMTPIRERHAKLQRLADGTRNDSSAEAALASAQAKEIADAFGSTL